MQAGSAKQGPRVTERPLSAVESVREFYDDSEIAVRCERSWSIESCPTCPVTLEVRDIEFDQRHIVVRHAMSEDQSLTPKSGAERTVPLAAELEQRLRDAVKDKFPRARVVLDANGQTPSRQTVLRVFKLYLRDASLKERSFHALRHYFISELMRGGASAEAVRVLAGHSTLEMTQRYAHVVTADLRAAIDRLGK